MPPGLSRSHLDDLLAEAPEDIRFHLSRGAAESFANTLPLLHPRGYLQVQDIFVPAMDEYRQGFKGPGKLDGSFVTWVNGALLRAVGARAGYDVHFAPFRYRPGSKTRFFTPRNATDWTMTACPHCPSHDRDRQLLDARVARSARRTTTCSAA